MKTPATDVRPMPSRCAATAAEIAELANSSIERDEFVRRALEKIVEVLGARAAALWNLSTRGVLSLGGDVRLAETGVTRDPAASRLNVNRLLEVTRTGQAGIFDQPSASRIESARAVVLIAPVSSRECCLGALEIFLDHEPESSEHRVELLQFGEEICGSVAWFLSWRDESQSAAASLEFWERYERSVLKLHQTLDPRRVAMNAVHEGQRLLESDRLSLVVRLGVRTRVLAISGQERINHAANLVRSLVDLAAPAIRENQVISSGGDINRFPPEVAQLLVQHLQVSGGRLVKAIPLEEPPAPPSVESETTPAAESVRAFGALVVEHFTSDRLSPVAEARWSRFAGQVAAALYNAREHEQVFLLPLRRALGRCHAWFSGRRLLKSMAALLLAAGLTTALVFVPATYRVEGKGKLMPSIQRSVFAPWDGEVTAVLIAGGDRIDAGQPLLRLRNDELQTQLLAARNRLAEKQQQFEALQAEINDGNRRTVRPDDVIRLRGRLAQTKIELDGAEERALALERQMDLLTVRSPIAGTIAGFQIEQTLLNRPVRRGDALVEVMDEDGDWRLEITVPEQRLGHLLRASRSAGQRRLPADFVLATTPEETYRGEVAQVSTRTDVLPDQGPVVDVQIMVTADEIQNRRIGAEAVAWIDCGRRSLAYVLFGDAVEFVQRRLW